MKKDTKATIDLFCLEGKITDKHAEEIAEIFDVFLDRAHTAGGMRMLKIISKEQAWEESEEHYKNKFLKL